MKDTERYNNMLMKKHIDFCEEYLRNGHNVGLAAKVVFKNKNRAYKQYNIYGWSILRKPEIKAYLKERMAEVSAETKFGFNEKVKKLVKVVNLAIPDEAEHIKETAPREGIAAISELNKMEGHYAPEKRINANVDIIAAVDARVKEIEGEYEREY